MFDIKINASITNRQPYISKTVRLINKKEMARVFTATSLSKLYANSKLIKNRNVL